MGGRPASVPKDTFRSVILAHKSALFTKNKLAVKSDSIWNEISKCFQNKITGNSIYAMVCANRYDTLTSLKGKNVDNENIVQDANFNCSTDQEEQMCKKSNFYNEKNIEFEVEIPRETFDEMTMEVDYLRSTREGSNKKRKYLKFKYGVWQAYFNKILWDQFQMECGLHYDDHNLTLNQLSGKFKGNYLILYVLLIKILLLIVQFFSRDF